MEALLRQVWLRRLVAALVVLQLVVGIASTFICLLYTSPSPRDS